MPWHRQATVAVFPAYKFTRFDNNIKLLMGHKGAVTDIGFSPFNKQLLCTTSEDGTAKLWLIPEDGVTEDIKEADADLLGHTKKVMACQWHRTAENVLATHSADGCVRIWDVAQQASTLVFPEMGNIGTGMKWSPAGDRLAVVTKMKDLFVFDPRKPEAAI